MQNNVRRLFCVTITAAFSGMTVAGGSSTNVVSVKTPAVRQAYAETMKYLQRADLPLARQTAVDAVSSSVARLPSCVTTQNTTTETITYFPAGEALRFYQTVPGGRVNYYELRPDGAFRVWQAIPKKAVASTDVVQRVFGVTDKDTEQCGVRPRDCGTLAFYNNGPFNADFRYGFVKADGSRVVLGRWNVKQNLGEIRQRGQSVFHLLIGERIVRVKAP